LKVVMEAVRTNTYPRLLVDDEHVALRVMSPPVDETPRSSSSSSSSSSSGVPGDNVALSSSEKQSYLFYAAQCALVLGREQLAQSLYLAVLESPGSLQAIGVAASVRLRLLAPNEELPRRWMSVLRSMDSLVPVLADTLPEADDVAFRATMVELGTEGLWLDALRRRDIATVQGVSKTHCRSHATVSRAHLLELTWSRHLGGASLDADADIVTWAYACDDADRLDLTDLLRQVQKRVELLEKV
jgi:hypothetical protein